jgi:hypothetical protein
MGIKTFSEFQTDLKFELGQRTDLDSYLDDWVNAAYIDLCTRNRFWESKFGGAFDFPELHVVDDSQATADGYAYVNTPSGVLYVEQIHDTTNDFILRGISWREYVEKTGRATAASEGKPKKWVRYGERIYLNPTPDSAYNLDISFRKVPAKMVNDSDVTDIGTEWDEVILKLAVIQSLMRLKEYEWAEIERKEWINLVSDRLGMKAKEDGAKKTFIQPDYQANQYGYDR